MQVPLRMRARDLWVLTATIVGSSLTFIDGMVVALALPAIQREFHATAADVAWIVELYTLVLGALMLLGGALADRYGRRRIFLIGALVFGAGSIGCAFAWSLPVILLMRALQGLGGMLVAPASLAILGNHFSGNARGRAIAAWSAFSALTSTVGPALGGALIDAFGWRSVFWINVPLVALVVALALRHVAESRDDNAPNELDVLGALLGTFGLGGVIYALIVASSSGWASPRVVSASVAGIVLLALFILRERLASAPLVPPSIFRSRTFGSINLATLFLYGAAGALFYELPFAMIQAHHYTALQTALAMLPMLLCLVVLSRFGAAAAQRFGYRIVLTGGPLVVASGFALLALFEPRAGYVAAFLPGLLVIGIGMGFTVAPLTTTVISSADPQHVGVASGINNAVARIASLLSVAAIVVLVAALYNASFDRSLDAMHAGAGSRAAVDRQRDRLGGARFADPRLQHASVTAFENGFRGVAIACAVLAALAAAVDALGIDEQSIRTS